MPDLNYKIVTRQNRLVGFSNHHEINDAAHRRVADVYMAITGNDDLLERMASAFEKAVLTLNESIVQRRGD